MRSEAVPGFTEAPSLRGLWELWRLLVQLWTVATMGLLAVSCKALRAGWHSTVG